MLIKKKTLKDTIKKIIKYVISASIAVVLLWFSFRDVEWVEFMAGLKSCSWGFIAMSMVAGAFAFWLRALRWRQLLLPIDSHTSLTTTFNGINIGNISNFVLPRIGEFVRCGVIVRRAQLRNPDFERRGSGPLSYEKVIGTVVLERGWELMVMLLMLAIVVVGGYDRFGAFFIDEIWTPMSQKLDFSLWWLLAVVASAAVVGIWAVWKFKDNNSFCSRIWDIFTGILQGFSSCLRMDRKWLFFAYTAFIWLTYWFMAASTIWAAPFLDHLDMVDALFLSLVGGLGFAVPVPGGIGAFHFIIGLTLATIYGVPMETGIIYATISHTSQAVTQILFGIGSYSYEALKK